MSNFEIIPSEGALIKAWNKGVPFGPNAIEQTQKVAKLPFVKGIALMPDCHFGWGCTVGSVIASQGAIVPSLVGVDIGCGMMAVRTNATAETYKNCLPEIFSRISNAVPHGRTNDGGVGDRGSWHNVPEEIHQVYQGLFAEQYEECCIKHPGMRSKNAERQLGTLGTGNHFIELSLDEQDRLWVVLHSGSRGFGNRIGTYFQNLAAQKCEAWMIELPDRELAYLPAACQEYHDYIAALNLAQKFAWHNRCIMMDTLLAKLSLKSEEVVHCHHNYMTEEGNVLITRKGAVRAKLGDVVCIPGSMGACTFIARGLGNRDSYFSCSHGAGRTMGRNQARQRITLAEHEAATEGVYCHKGVEVIDESPAAYKSIEAVMAAQNDLVEPILKVKQILCVKGLDYKERKVKHATERIPKTSNDHGGL